MNENAQRKPRLLQQRVRLGNLRQRAPEDVCTAICRFMELMIELYRRWKNFRCGQNVTVLHEVDRLIAPHPIESLTDNTAR